MRSNRFFVLLSILALAIGSATVGCAKKEAPAPAADAAAAPAAPAAPADGGKIPVTTASADAKAEYLQGRDLVYKLVITDSIAHFQKAVQLDPNFALAELSLANSAYIAAVRRCSPESDSKLSSTRSALFDARSRARSAATANGVASRI